MYIYLKHIYFENDNNKNNVLYNITQLTYYHE